MILHGSITMSTQHNIKNVIFTKGDSKKEKTSAFKGGGTLVFVVN